MSSLVLLISNRCQHRSLDIIEPKNLCTVHVSPRMRAQQTFKLLFEHVSGPLPKHVLDEDVQEWNYGTCYKTMGNTILTALRRGI